MVWGEAAAFRETFVVSLLQVQASHAVGAWPGSCAEVALSVLRVMKNVVSPHNAFEICTAPLTPPPDPLAQMFPMEDRGKDGGDRGCVWASLRSGIAEQTEEVMSVPRSTGEWAGGGGCLGNAAAPPPSPPCMWCCKQDYFHKLTEDLYKETLFQLRNVTMFCVRYGSWQHKITLDGHFLFFFDASNEKHLRILSVRDKESLLSTFLSSGEVLGSIRDRGSKMAPLGRVAVLKTFILVSSGVEVRLEKGNPPPPATSCAPVVE